jgi:hypothetical protein
VRLLWPSSTLSQPRSSDRGFTSDPAHWLETETESIKKVEVEVTARKTRMRGKGS